MSKYLFCLKNNTYNNRKPFYEIKPFPNSDISRGIIFGGSMEKIMNFKADEKFNNRAITYVYLEMNKAITLKNRYNSITKLCHLICLATGLPAEPTEIDIKKISDFEGVFDKYKCLEYFKEGVVYGGRITQPNAIEKVLAYCEYLNKIDSESNLKFENALQTFCWAYELEMLPNPQLRYTLYVTLYLSSINQLADNPKVKCKGHCICSECGDKIDMQHKTGSDRDEIEKLIRKLITGDNVNEAVSLAKKMYSKIRSNYLHSGLLSGAERVGGFFAVNVPGKHFALLLNQINISNLNRMLLELFLQYEAKNHQ